MTGVSAPVLWLAGGLLCALLLLMLHRPIMGLLKLFLRSCVSFGVLACLQPLHAALGLGLNFFNALVMGLLGAPGFGLLLLLRWALRE